MKALLKSNIKISRNISVILYLNYLIQHSMQLWNTLNKEELEAKLKEELKQEENADETDNDSDSDSSSVDK